MKYLRTILLLIACFVVTSRADAQVGTIKGVVEDSLGAPLEFVNVGLRETKLGAYTDNKGAFTLTDVPVGTYGLVISHVGYRVFKQEVTVENGQIAEIRVTLFSSAFALQRIEVLAVNEKPSVLRGPVALEDVPRNIRVFSEDEIQKIRPQGLEEIVTLAPNVTFGGPGDGREHSFLVRGFDAPLLRDGFNVDNFGGAMDPETFGQESTEVLKGPDSIQYGQSDPGGLINMVSKRPTIDPFRRIELQGGSFGSAETRIDLSGPVGQSKNVTYRLPGLYSYGEHWRDYDTKKTRLFFGPSLRWRMSERTKLTMFLEVTRDKGPADFGTAINNNGELVAPVERVNNHPQDTLERNQFIAGHDFEHFLSDNWAVGNRFRYLDTNYEFSSLWLPAFFDDATGNYTRFPARQKQDNKQLAAQFTLAGDVKLGSNTNRFLLGVDLRRQKAAYSTGYDPSQASVINFLNPDYSEMPLAESQLPWNPNFTGENRIDAAGVFFQDHFSITDDLILSGGLRYDYVTNEGYDYVNSRISDQKDKAWTPQAGLVWHASEQVSLYGNYSESFTPSFSADINGDPLEPEVGEGLEVGTRIRPDGSRFQISVSAFQVTKVNVATADPNDPAFPFGASIASGKLRSRGVETELTGNLAPGLQAIAGLGFVRTKVLEDNTDLKDNAFIRVPEVTADLWVTYELPQGLGLGAGVNYVGKRWVDTANTITIDPHTLLNASVYYSRNGWRFDMVLHNLTNQKYVSSAWGGTGRSVHPGRPFEAIWTIGYGF